MLNFLSMSTFVLIALFFHLVHARYQKGLHKLRGPILASVSNLWKFWVVYCEEMPQINTALHEKYGPLVRIGPKDVSASSSDAVAAIYRSGTGFKKSPIYGILQPKIGNDDLHNLFSTQDPVVHTRLKRHLGRLYSMTAVTGSEVQIDSCIDLLISRLTNISANSSPVNISAWMQFYAFDCLGEVNFSKKLGFLSKGKDIDGICSHEYGTMMYYALMGQMRSLERIWSFMRSYTALKKVNPLFTFARNEVQNRLPVYESSGQKDLLNSLLEVHHNSPHTFQVSDVVAAVYINILTAHEVLAITLRAILYYLAKNPSIRHRLCQEIDDACSAGELSHPAKYSEAARLPYLNAVINEALRIHPSTGLILERIVPKGGIKLHGILLAEGTVIGVNCWVLNRNKDIFGEDVETFSPDRWIDRDEEEIKNMKRCLFTFSTGSRSCIGKNLAVMQITKVVVELYRHFEIELVEPTREWRVSGAWLTSQTEMDMNLTERLRG